MERGGGEGGEHTRHVPVLRWQVPQRGGQQIGPGVDVGLCARHLVPRDEHRAEREPGHSAQSGVAFPVGLFDRLGHDREGAVLLGPVAPGGVLAPQLLPLEQEL
ncbi:hypothetical protein AB0D38_11865 [Streptomyces sp. NPDC048279]|uniref:hypothetical protein n=1 Tax=Streptomyces sp. NPDC048279 TaxID=3154714 RepID=UPI0034411693